MNTSKMIKPISLLLLLISLPCAALQPAPDLSPVDVVTYQLKSLQENTNGEGIADTFRFASPANKRVTGPIERFSRLFDHIQYRPMLNHQSAQVTLLSNNGTVAEVLTEVIDQDGSIHQYRFRLSIQERGANIDCWLTDAVIWEPKPGRSA